MEDDLFLSEWEAKVKKATDSLPDKVYKYKPKKYKSPYLKRLEEEAKERISSYDPNDRYYTSTGEDWENEDW